jgi:hypothetical protein
MSICGSTAAVVCISTSACVEARTSKRRIIKQPMALRILERAQVRRGLCCSQCCFSSGMLSLRCARIACSPNSASRLASGDASPVGRMVRGILANVLGSFFI